MSEAPLYQRVVAAMKPGWPDTVQAVCWRLVDQGYQGPYKAVGTAMLEAERQGLVHRVGSFETRDKQRGIWLLTETPKPTETPRPIAAWFLEGA